jgi:hypothetical protein
VDDAGAALAGVTADVGAGQAEMVAKELDEQGAVLDIAGNRLAVHRQFDCGHTRVLPMNLKLLLFQVGLERQRISIGILEGQRAASKSGVAAPGRPTQATSAGSGKDAKRSRAAPPHCANSQHAFEKTECFK